MAFKPFPPNLDIDLDQPQGNKTMKIGEAFPSKYLSSEDLRDKPHRLRMNYVRMEKLGDDEKPILYFVGKPKGIVLNKTNATTIASLYGDDTDNWPDQEIEIYPSETDYAGKRVPCIRVRAVRNVAPMPPDRIAPNARARTALNEMQEGRFAPPPDEVDF